MTVIGLAATELERFHSRPSYNDCWHVLRYLEQAAGLLHIIGSHDEELIWRACNSLLQMAHDTLNAGMEKLPHD